MFQPNELTSALSLYNKLCEVRVNWLFYLIQSSFPLLFWTLKFFLTGDKILCKQTGKKYDVQEIGVMAPDMTPVTSLIEGQVGYMIANMRQATDALIGDTVCLSDKPVEALPGFKKAQPMVCY